MCACVDHGMPTCQVSSYIAHSQPMCSKQKKGDLLHTTKQRVMAFPPSRMKHYATYCTSTMGPYHSWGQHKSLAKCPNPTHILEKISSAKNKTKWDLPTSPVNYDQLGLLQQLLVMKVSTYMV